MKKRNGLDLKRLNDLVFIQFNRKIAKKRKIMKKDVLLAPDDSRALHWKKSLVKEENKDEEIFFLSLEATGENKNPNQQSLKTFR